MLQLPQQRRSGLGLAPLHGVDRRQQGGIGRGGHPVLPSQPDHRAVGVVDLQGLAPAYVGGVGVHDARGQGLNSPASSRPVLVPSRISPPLGPGLLLHRVPGAAVGGGDVEQPRASRANRVWVPGGRNTSPGTGRRRRRWAPTGTPGPACPTGSCGSDRWRWWAAPPRRWRPTP